MRLALLVQGIVQGTGFRPYVWRLAHANQLSGWVRNTHDGVRIEVQGERGRLDGFLNDLRRHPPPQARIERLEIREVLSTELNRSNVGEFIIRDSMVGHASQTMIPPDIATCSECLGI